ncbi:MAG TPA: M3 family metallopeptidase [Kofleriaceae bacterium]
MRRISLAFVIFAACSGGSKQTLVLTPAQPPEPVGAPAVSTTPPIDPQADAQQRVKRLAAEADQNPLLAVWTGPYGGVPPWDKIKSDLFPAAFAKGIELRAAEVDVIASLPEAPTFQNTYAALDDAGRHLDRAETLFSVMTSSLNTKDVQAVDREWSPKLTAAMDAITFNPKLFARMDKVYAARASAGLTPEQVRMVEQVYDRFVRTGAKLTPDQKKEMGRINQELAVLFTDFGNRVLKDEDTWVVLEKEEELAGLPKSLVDSAKAAATERKLEGKWVIVNTRSSVDPFLTFSTKRELREKVWKAFKGRGDNGGETDTNDVIVKIVALRAQRAALLGYPTHAHWRMANTMAKDPEKADALMLRVWPAAVARVKEEVADMAKIAKREGAKITIEPWDYLFYAEKVRKQKYALDQDQLKPYFELNNMIAGSFFMAEKLYDLQFTEITGKAPVFHPDVRVWEVKDKSTGKFRGLFYGDYFARANKRSGAWASVYQGHETFTGKQVTVITSNNNNFVKGAAGEPVLISLDDAETLFHEFGHGLHALLSEVNYPSLANTPRDFVEYPSQVHEMWVMTKPILEKYALHYKTKKPMPQALIKKVFASEKFNQGYGTVEFLSSAILDMTLHMTKDKVTDPKAFERDTLTRIGAPKEVAMRHRLPQFLHLFSSDSYSAGYYSYLWSEVMDADTRQAFADTKDVFHKPTAEKMRKYILAPGNSTDRTEAYRQFRGRDPDVKALLEKRGFPTK